MAAGVLAFSGVGAPVAVASDPDQDIEGSVELVAGGDSGAVELGDRTTALADAEAELPDDVDVSTASDEADAPAAQAPVEDVAEPGMVATGESAEPVVDTPEPEPEPAPEPVAVAAPPVEVPVATPGPESGGSVGPSVDRAEETKRERPRVEAVRESVERTAVAAPVGAPARTDDSGHVAPVAAVGTEARAPVAVRVVAGAGSSARGGRATTGDRVHVVQRGESLWSIAADVLGERARVGRIAREVNRLWALNEDRIASGNPNLLYAGTRLRLR